MRGLGILAAGAAVLTLATSAPVAAESVEVESEPLTADLTISPKVLPEQTPGPAALRFAWGQEQGPYVPFDPVAEIAISLDRNVGLDFRGYPKCETGPILFEPTLDDLERMCRDSIVAEGSAGFQVRLNDAWPIDLQSPVIVFNGGRSSGARRLYAHAAITVPVPARIVMTIEIRRLNLGGRYGTEAAISTPKIAGGSGALTKLNFKFDKRFRRDGRRVSIVSARCNDGKLQTKLDLRFSSGASRETELIRPCTPRDD